MYINQEIDKNLKQDCITNDFKVLYVKDFNEDGFKQFLDDFTKASKNEQSYIPIIVDSYGGAVYSLMGMVDIIRSSKVPVVTIATTKAMSCGAVLVAAGTKGYRFMSPSANLLVHDVSAGARGKIKDMENSVGHAADLQKKLMGMLDFFSGQKKGFYDKLIHKRGRTDLYFTPKTCKRLGLIDHIGIPSFSVKVDYKVTINY